MTTGLANAAMLAVMLLHAVLGCCWHHSHEVCAASAVDSTASVAEEHDRTGGHRCPCGHHDEGETPGSDEEPQGGHGGHDCCGEVCQFLVSAGVAVPNDSGMSRGHMVADSASGLEALLEASRRARSDGPPSDPLPTKRLLTRLCVWRL